MKITTILFDLDGTLLPMDQETFVKAYFKGLITKTAPYGYDAQKLINTLWSGITAMVSNTGETNNEAVFWEVFAQAFGEESRKDTVIFEDFYNNEFQNVKHACGFQPLAAQLISQLKEAGCRIILATNPIFPALATKSRVRWAGLEPTDFELITTYENSFHCKPNPEYYRDILKTIGADPQECLMVGNDVGEDMVAASLGMNVFLLTDCLINQKNADISNYPHGDFKQLTTHISALK